MYTASEFAQKRVRCSARFEQAAQDSLGDMPFISYAQPKLRFGGKNIAKVAMGRRLAFPRISRWKC